MKEQGNKPTKSNKDECTPQHKRLAMGQKPAFTGQKDNKNRPTRSNV